MNKDRDYEILTEREKMKRLKYNTLDNGYYIAGKIVHFQDREVMDAVRIPLPDTMGIMPQEFARVKYPSEFRPKVILTTLDLSVNMGFSLFHRKMTADEIVPVTKRMKGAIKRDHPDYQFLRSGRTEKGTGNWFTFRSHAMDSDLYNLMAITNVEEKTILGNFNCPYKDYGQWENAVLLMFKSIKPIG